MGAQALDRWIGRVENAVGNGERLRELEADLALAPALTANEREHVLGRIQRYQENLDDLRARNIIRAVDVSLTQPLHDDAIPDFDFGYEGADEGEVMVEEGYIEHEHPRNRLGRWRDLLTMPKPDYTDTIAPGVRYRESKRNEASNILGRVEVGPKFFDLKPEQRKLVLAHELGHDHDDELLASPEMAWVWDEENWLDAEGIPLNGPGATPGERIADAVAAVLLDDQESIDRWPAIERIANWLDNKLRYTQGMRSEGPGKRKISYEQSLALDRGRATARTNQRRRMADKEAAAKADAERERMLAEHRHAWKNWEYAEDYKTESRACRICGEVETRPVRL